jgi:hypothetical protein
MKNYIKNLKGFYKTKRDSLLQDYQKVKDAGGADNFPFEMFVITLCEDDNSQELYEWVGERWTKLAEEYVALGLMNPSVRDNYGVKSDLFMYILWYYSQEQSQTTT